jgi:hypothetical protein
MRETLLAQRENWIKRLPHRARSVYQHRQSFVSRQDIKMGRREKKAMSLLVASGMMGLAMFATKPALAGTNGKQILFCANGSDYQQVGVEGVNENDDFQQVAYQVDLDKHTCSDPWNDYWVGEVKLTWMQSASGDFPRHESTCLIPERSTIDTTTCVPKVDAASQLSAWAPRPST